MMDKFAHRKAQSVITLKDAQGNVMPGRKVQFDLTKHEFLFGTGAFWSAPLADPSTKPEHKAYLEKIWESWQKLFNYGTLSFYQGRYEPQEGVTMEVPTMHGARFLKEHGVTTKGHPLCWHTVAAKWLMGRTPEEVLENQLHRIRREVSAFKGVTDMWDVINEVVIMPIFTAEENAITPLCQKLGRVGLVKAVFDEARKTNPDATLLLNDFNTSEKYRELIEQCLEAGVPMDVIGIQSHQHQGFWGMEKLHEVLDRFASFNMPMHFTENTFVSGDLMPPHIVDLNDWQVPEWPTTPEGEERQAQNWLDMADTLFEHPLVEAMTGWDYIDGAWLGAPSGLVRKDGSCKPAWHALDQRINHDWSTHVTLMTDENGQVTLDGIRGEYTLKVDGQEAKLTLKKDQPELTVQL
ncbi:MAG: endo-1,4-beta-xylanase [Clostridia bacterium]|nr:endo-1,4-beta-xylanase [Clostridia bacterium]